MYMSQHKKIILHVKNLIRMSILAGKNDDSLVSGEIISFMSAPQLPIYVSPFQYVCAYQPQGHSMTTQSCVSPECASITYISTDFRHQTLE